MLTMTTMRASSLKCLFTPVTKPKGSTLISTTPNEVPQPSPMPVTYFLTIIQMLSSHVHLSPFVAALKVVSLLKFGTSGVNVLNMLQIFLSERGNHMGM